MSIKQRFRLGSQLSAELEGKPHTVPLGSTCMSGFRSYMLEHEFERSKLSLNLLQGSLACGCVKTLPTIILNT